MQGGLYNRIRSLSFSRACWQLAGHGSIMLLRSFLGVVLCELTACYFIFLSLSTPCKSRSLYLCAPES